MGGLSQDHGKIAVLSSAYLLFRGGTDRYAAPDLAATGRSDIIIVVGRWEKYPAPLK